MILELRFPVLGDRLRADHAYMLYGALSRIVPEFHQEKSPFRFAPITGERFEKGMIHLTEGSQLVVRLPEDRIRTVLPLAGKKLQVGEDCFRLRMPQVTTLNAVPALTARIVVFKNAVEPGSLVDHCRQQLAKDGIVGEPAIPLIETGERRGEPKRMIVRIVDKAIIGYAVNVSGLSPQHSTRLQEIGLGGRTHIGCGFFWPARKEEGAK